MAENEVTEKLKVTLNMDDLTFGEMEDFEDATGLVMSDAVKSEIVRDPRTGMALPDPEDPKGRPLRESKMSARAMMGLVFIALRRDNPALTFAEVRSMRLSDVDFDMTEGVDDEGKDEETVSD